MIPILTLADPPVAGEGALDPLGLTPTGERLAELILPSMRARMSRPRFITAMAVAARVCEGLDDVVPGDGVTPPQIAFEWLYVEAFVRTGDAARNVGIPGILKAQRIRQGDGQRMCAQTYLRTPGVFGFHGIYKPLARNIGVLDDGFLLGDVGNELLRIWERAEGLSGFSADPPSGMWRVLRDAVDGAVRKGYSDSAPGWQGWRFLAERLAPWKAQPAEADCLARHIGGGNGLRAEVFALLRPFAAGERSEADLVREALLPKASTALSPALEAIVAYEEFASTVEAAFDTIRHLSTASMGRAIGPSEFSRNGTARSAVADVPALLENASERLDAVGLATLPAFESIRATLGGVRTTDELFTAVLDHHRSVQHAKPPEGKREWFETASDGGVIVRPPYRKPDAAVPSTAWNRPYRIDAARSFLRDLGVQQ